MNILLISGRDADGREQPESALVARRVADLQAAGHAVRWLRPQAPWAPGVQARLGDAALEIAVTRAMRERLPDQVRILAFGGGTAAQLPWVAERMGQAAVVETTAAAVLCHRGTLLHASGMACAEFDQPERCAACCGLARRTRVELANRLELVLGCLLVAAQVVVPDERDRQLLLAAGLSARQLRIASHDQ